MNKETKVTETKKEKKPKGPVRLEAIVPLFIVMVVSILYFTLFFDLHLRKTAEFVGTQVNGAEVNIDSIRTSFWKATFRLNRLQVTDPDHPQRNTFEIGTIHFHLLWDALLRAKFVIDEAGVEDIAALTPRDKPGHVLTPEERAASDAMKRRIREMVQERLRNTDLARLPQILKSLNPKEKLKNITNLKSLAHIAGLQKQLDAKEKEWKKALREIPGQKEMSSLQKKISSIQVKGGNPAEIKRQIEQARGLVNESKTMAGAVTTKAAGLKKDVTYFETSIGSVDDMIARDRRNMEKELRLPSVDTKGLSKQLFGVPSVEKVAQVEKYTSMARQYMPAKSESKEKPTAIKPARRAAGHTYQFGIPKSYPVFWLKKAVITSKAGPSEFSGNIDGLLTDATTDPAQVGRPTVLNLQGDFPKQGILAVNVHATLDHRQSVPVDTFRVGVGSYPVSGKNFSDTEDLKLGINKARGKTFLHAVLSGKKVNIRADNSFSKVDYRIGGNSPWLISIFKDVVRQLPVLTLNLTATGTFENLKFGLESNLARALQKGIQAQLKGRLDGIRKQIDGVIHGKVGSKKKALTSRFDRTKSGVLGQVEGRRKQAAALQNQAQGKVNSLKKKLVNAQTRKVRKKATKALGGVRKKFGF